MEDIKKTPVQFATDVLFTMKVPNKYSKANGQQENGH